MMNGEKNVKEPGVVELRLHGLAWVFPGVLLLLAPLTWGWSLLPAVYRAAQLWRSRQWLQGAEVFAVRGILFRQQRSLRLADVQFVQVKPCLFGQAIDCGTVIVHGPSGTKLMLKHLAHPRSAQRAIQRAVNAVPRRAGSAALAGAAEPLIA